MEKSAPPEKADPPINFPLLTKSVTWDTVWYGYTMRNFALSFRPNLFTSHLYIQEVKNGVWAKNPRKFSKFVLEKNHVT